MASLQVCFVVDTSGIMNGPWSSMKEIVLAVVRAVLPREVPSNGETTRPGLGIECSLVEFCEHPPYGNFTARGGPFRPRPAVEEWMKALHFQSGGYEGGAVLEGLCLALELPWSEHASKHCILISATSPHGLPAQLPGSSLNGIEFCDLAQRFVDAHINLSVVASREFSALRDLFQKASMPGVAEHVVPCPFMVLLRGISFPFSSSSVPTTRIQAQGAVPSAPAIEKIPPTATSGVPLKRPYAVAFDPGSIPQSSVPAPTQFVPQRSSTVPGGQIVIPSAPRTSLGLSSQPPLRQPALTAEQLNMLVQRRANLSTVRDGSAHPGQHDELGLTVEGTEKEQHQQVSMGYLPTPMIAPRAPPQQRSIWQGWIAAGRSLEAAHRICWIDIFLPKPDSSVDVSTWPKDEMMVEFRKKGSLSPAHFQNACALTVVPHDEPGLIGQDRCANFFDKVLNQNLVVLASLPRHTILLIPKPKEGNIVILQGFCASMQTALPDFHQHSVQPNQQQVLAQRAAIQRLSQFPTSGGMPLDPRTYTLARQRQNMKPE